MKKVSIWMITYNHEPYIAQAIEGILMQEVNFNYELVIGDDDSTDQTRAICETYAATHPDKIKVLDTPHNLGIAQNMARTLEACTGKYIAMCEGDDYWIDPLKLQKQFNFMESHEEYALCYTHCKEVNELDGSEKICGIERPSTIDLPYLLKEGWFMRTPTLFFRNGLITTFPEWFYTAYSTDYILHILLASKGKVGKLPDVTAVYRRHEGGISIVPPYKQLTMWKDKIKLLSIINKYYLSVYKKELEAQKARIAWAMFVTMIKERIFSARMVLFLFPYFISLYFFFKLKNNIINYK